jgi:hypothetical protein
MPNTRPIVDALFQLAAQTLVHLLKRSGSDLSRANVMTQAASIKDLALPLLLPGIKLNRAGSTTSRSSSCNWRGSRGSAGRCSARSTTRARDDRSGSVEVLVA